jgi:hypothetical protein
VGGKEGEGRREGGKWAGSRKREREKEKHPNAFEFEFKI